MIGRSKKVESKSLRGGAAVYKNNCCDLSIEVVYDEFVDCVVCRITNTDVILVALYIPPINSAYYNEKYFQNLETIYNIFNSYQLLLMMGDLNCRVGILPDTTINTNGSRLKKWLQDKDLVVLNGYKADDPKHFDADFTFYRGASRSQNDLVLANNINMVNSLKILKKDVHSDHTPVAVTINVSPWCSVNFIQGCAKGTFSDDHWDINKRKMTPLIAEKIDWPNAILELEEKAASLMGLIQGSEKSNDELVALITRTIYDTCKDNYKRMNTDGLTSISMHNPHLKSANMKAIAEMNLYTYNVCTNKGDNMDVRKPYLEAFMLYSKLAEIAENKEINARKNIAWKKARGDGKSMWKLIDWKGKADLKKEVLIQEEDITPYFKKIFQSEKTRDHPKVDSVLERLEAYSCYVPGLDDTITMSELTSAVKKVGSGCGLDGIRADIIRMMPPGLLNCLLELLKRVFGGEYPKQWEIQVLNAVAKDGHSSKNPKLRGIGIAAILARIYDIILDERFRKWYTPNREQAGFCAGRGCPFPLFSIFLLLHYSIQNNKEFCIGFMDYEKAFDFANRAKIVTKLMEKGCGKTFTEAITKMFHSTTYIPSTNNKLCEEIKTAYGVAQGRNSSPNIYSFAVSDMASCTRTLEQKDFIDPHCLAQLADDTAMLAEGLKMLGPKMKCLLDYSHEIHQIPNIPKTVFCHFSNDPITTPLQIDENTHLDSVDPIKGHKYIDVKTGANFTDGWKLMRRPQSKLRLWSWMSVFTCVSFMRWK